MAENPHDEDMVSMDDRDMFDHIVYLRNAIRKHRDNKMLPFAPPPTEEDRKLYAALPEEERKDEQG